MQVTYQLTQRDFFDAFIAHRNRKPLIRWAIRGLIAICIFAFLLAVLMVALKPDLESARSAAVFGVLIAFWCLLIWGVPWWAARTQFRHQPAAQGERTLVVDSESYQSLWSTGTGKVEWRHFAGWLESKNLILLYSSPILFDIVPKRALTPEQLDEFRELLAKNVVQK